MVKTEGRGGRTGKPVDDFEDDRTGDTGDDAATKRAVEAVATAATGTHTAGGGANETLETKAERYILDIEGQQDEVDAIDAQAKIDKRPYRDEIAAIYKAAAEDNIPKKVLRALVTRRRKLAQAAAIATKLNEEQADNYKELADALGEDFMTNTPLGLHAAEKVKPSSRKRG